MPMRLVLSSLRLMALLLLVNHPLLLKAQRPSMTPKESAKLRNFLRDYLHDSYESGHTTRYFASFVDLTGGGGRQAIVYLTDQQSCGSGGCTTLVLAPAGSSYKVITSVTIGWAPIRV